MTDDNHARYRSQEHDERGHDPAAPQNDPLAELARLIGQSNPFADLERDMRAVAAQREAEQRRAYQRDEDQYSHERYQFEPEQTYEPLSDEHNEPSADERHDSRSDERYEPYPEERYEPQSVAPPIWPEATVPVNDYDNYGPDADPDRFDQTRYDHRAYTSDPYNETQQPADQERPDNEANPDTQVTPDIQDDRSVRSTQGESILPSDYRAPSFGRDAVAHALAEQAALSAHAVETFGETAEPRRPRWVPIAALLALAAVGSGSALAYRTFFDGSSTPTPPPIIRASAEPTKVVPPPPPASDTNAGKIHLDRSGDRSANEQVVVREEKPLDPNKLVSASPPAAAPAFPPPPAAAPAPSGPVFPPPPAAAAPPPAVLAPGTIAQVPAQPTANPPSVLTEPKRVRTVTVRPDQPDAAVRPLASVTPSPSPSAAPPPAPPVRRPNVANAPLDVSPQASAQLPSRGVTATPQVAAPARAPANGPLSLTPTGSTPPRAAKAATPPAQVAAVPPAPATSQNGRYHVQVSSQRSEGDAQTAFRTMQAKYASVLGGHRPVIRRADLGAKGIYYRAMVGPFATRDQAVQLCASLKAAGGDCVVQNN